MKRTFDGKKGIIPELRLRQSITPHPLMPGIVLYRDKSQKPICPLTSFFQFAANTQYPRKDKAARRFGLELSF